MAARFGNVLYWLGLGTAFICIVGAILVALGVFADLPSAVGYLKPSTEYTVKISPPDFSAYAEPVDTPLSEPAPRQPFADLIPYKVRVRDLQELDRKLPLLSQKICEDLGVKSCFWRGGTIAWEVHPLGALPSDPAVIADAYNFQIVDTKGLHIWKEDYSINLAVTGLLLISALFLYGIGWAARYILRGPRTERSQG